MFCFPIILIIIIVFYMIINYIKNDPLIKPYVQNPKNK